MNEKPEALRLADRMIEGDEPYVQWQAGNELRRLHAENETLTATRDRQASMLRRLEEREAELDAEIGRLTKENERLRGLVRHILGDRITPKAYLLFGKAWVDEAHAALRREEA